MTSLISKKNTIENLVLALGIDPVSYPASFTECFHATTPEEQKVISGASSGFSRVLWGIIETIGGLELLSAEQVRTIVLNTKDGKITTSSMFKKLPKIASDGLNKAIGFQIIRKHPASEESQSLMIIRERIEANAALTKAGAKGAHKGGATAEVMEAVENGARAHTTFAQMERGLLIAYVAEKSEMDNDIRAKQLLRSIFKGRRELDWKMEALPMPSAI